MSTITTIAAGDQITNSRADINTNFSNLNTDKIETSVIDTDTALTANSDAKIPSQKAVKTYVDAGGNVNASETTKGIVEEATDAEVTAGTATGATGAKLFVTPTKLATSLSRTGINTSVTAGATINGATLPVPVYQNKTDNEFYACDANDATKYKFLGFAISNSTDGVAISVQFSGVVSGFSALDEGEKYYVQDTVGTIGTTPGTQEILVGVAISQTELFIQKGRRFASGAATFSSTTTSAITLGFRPSRVRIHAVGAVSGEYSFSNGGWDVVGGNRCVYQAGNETTGTSGTTTLAWFTGIQTLSTHTNEGIVTSITDTGFTLSNTKSNSPDSVVVYWEAEGEL